MTPADLAARLLAAIEETEQIARTAIEQESALDQLFSSKMLRHCAADRHVLARHALTGRETPGCTWCWNRWPCPDVIDRCAAYDVEVR